MIARKLAQPTKPQQAAGGGAGQAEASTRASRERGRARRPRVDGAGDPTPGMVARSAEKQSNVDLSRYHTSLGRLLGSWALAVAGTLVVYLVLKYAVGLTWL